MRRTLKVPEKRALKDYRVDFVRYDKIGTVKEAMNVFFRLHQKREVAKGDYGVFSNQLYKNFHMEVANAFAENGWLALFFLTFNDKPVSSVYAYEYNGKLYAYLSGFDTEYSHYRPGYLVIKNLIQYAIRKNLREFDFLRGEEQYKMRWRTTIRKNYEYRFVRRGLKSKLYNWGINSPYCSALYGLRSLPMRFLQKL
jgi:CelD/BcsL family acetyltransferase involved in cellulose biosynthesis